MTIRHGKIVLKNILSDTDFYVPVCNSIYCFKLLSQGPHKAVHTLRKQPQNESSTLQQMKLVKELCNSSKIFYSRAIRKEIQHKFKRLGFVKAHQAVFVIKDLLGDDSANNLENQSTVLHRLDMTVSCGDNIIVNLRKNNGSKLRLEKFWEVRYCFFHFILFYFYYYYFCIGR